MSFIWPEIDRIELGRFANNADVEIGKVPNEAINLIVLQENHEKQKYHSNKSIKNSVLSSFTLLTIEAQKPLKILKIPDIDVSEIVDAENIKTLSDAFNEGGVALTVDIINQKFTSIFKEPKRYAIIDSRSMKMISNKINNIESTKNIQGQKIQSKSNLTIGQLIMKLQKSSASPKMPEILHLINENIQTDLSFAELTSLSKAALSSKKPPIISKVQSGKYIKTN